MFDPIGKSVEATAPKPNTLRQLALLNQAPRHEEPDRVPISDFLRGGCTRRWRQELGLPAGANPEYHYELDWIVTVPNRDPWIRPFVTLSEPAEEVVVKTGFAAARAFVTAAVLAAFSALAAAEPTNAAEAAAKKATEDQRIDGLYQQKVATLSLERQAWETTLQENLGNAFYLAIHKRDFIKGSSTAWDFVADDPKLPRVLLIGDSVSRGYTLAVRAALAGKANLHRAPENCGPTANGLKKLDVWLGTEKWDVIHFNFGTHDRATPLADYESRLAQIMVRLKATGAKLIWASTTPIPRDETKKQTPESIMERNAAAARLAAQHGCAINDLFGFITPQLATTQNPNDVHFNARGYEVLGQQVAQAVAAVLR